MTVVIDSSVTLSWFFADERSAAADAVLDQVAESGAVVPSLRRLEVANALQMSVRRKRVDAAFEMRRWRI
jgi:predicted nucleic acid-binding protein